MVIMHGLTLQYVLGLEPSVQPVLFRGCSHSTMRWRQKRLSREQGLSFPLGGHEALPSLVSVGTIDFHSHAKEITCSSLSSSVASEEE